MSALALGFPGVAVTSLLMVGLSPAGGGEFPPPEATVCTAVLERDFTVDAGPIYPVAAQPNIWRDPDWLPASFFPPGEAAWPEVAIVENADVIAGELTYITDPTYSSVVLGNIATNATDFQPLFDAYGGNREIDLELDVNFHADLYAADTVPAVDNLNGIALLFSIFSESTAWRSMYLAAVDVDGPPTGTIALKLTYCIGAGGFNTVTIVTMPRAWADGPHNFKVKALPSTPLVPGSTTNHDLNPNGRIRVWIDDALVYENAAAVFRIAVAFKTQINDAFVVSALGLGHYTFVGGYTYVRLGYCDVADPPPPPEPPEPGGELPEAIEPAVSDLPTGILRVFAEWTYGLGEPYSGLAVAQTPLRDDADWHRGFKPAWLLGISDIERSLSPDLRGVSVTLTVADPGGLVFRALAATQNLSGSIWEIFVVSDTVRYAKGEPHRRFAGVVTDHQALPGWRYEFTLVDILSEDLGVLLDAPRFPPNIITAEVFPAASKDYLGRAIPVALGDLSDESETVPQGVWPPLIVAPSVNLSTFGGVNALAVPAILTQGAVPPNWLQGAYFSLKTNPYTRIPVPPSALGTIWTGPGLTGWNYVVGADPNIYLDYPLPPSAVTHRYSVAFFLATHPAVQDWVDGKSLLAFNGFGLTEFADGMGRYWADAPDIVEFLVRVFLKDPIWRFGDYPDTPTFFRGYSVVNHASIVRTRERLRAFGGGAYPVGALAGADGQQRAMRHVINEWCAGVLMDIGTDRHGRWMLDVLDPTAEAVWQLSDLRDIEQGSFTVRTDWKAYRNNAEGRWGLRYLPAHAPLPAPAEGEAMPAANLGPHNDWQSIASYEDTDAITANRGKRTPLWILENRVVRNSDVGSNWLQRVVTRAVGPSFNGPRFADLTTTWRTGALGVELGDVVEADHFQGVAAAGGYVGQRLRVEMIRDRLMDRRLDFVMRELPAEEPT